LKALISKTYFSNGRYQSFAAEKLLPTDWLSIAMKYIHACATH
jgi:hypothetical protein